MKIDKNKIQKACLPIGAALLFGGGVWIGSRFFASNSSNYSSKIERIMDLVNDNYVDEIDTDSLMEATIPDLLTKLDPHSTYIPAEDLEDVNADLEGSFSGIGVSFTLNKDSIVVLEVIAGGPSERSGLMAGDRIVTVDDSLMVGPKVTNAEVMSSLRGPKGSHVKLGIKRGASDKLLDFDIERGDIPTTSVDASYMIRPGIGYIKVNKFARSTYNEFITALATLHFKGANKFIIDLRGNGGGFMEMAVLMANEFLPEERMIVSTRSKNGDNDDALFSDNNGSFQGSDIVVLIDEFSASASEIFAGAIQDNDRGLIIGRRSFGKGLVQQQFELPDSSAIRLTVSRYYTPSGRSIQKPFKRGAKSEYENDLLERFTHGEIYSADSIKLDTTVTYMTYSGRPVYGGGGIMPDIFVPNDSTGITSYYIEVKESGMLHKFALDYIDRNRNKLSEASTLEELEAMLPEDRELLRAFALYADKEAKIHPVWRNVNISRDIIVSNLKAIIARDLLGMNALYEVSNRTDNTVSKALQILDEGIEKHLVTGVPGIDSQD